MPGLSSFHADAFCQSRPQSLIGEYFVECQPGHSGPVIKPGSTIPVTRTASTIPADLLQNVMRMPYRERFTLIINELGAAVAGRSGDLAAALRRAVPALTETDNLLNLLGNDSNTLQQLTSNSDAVITALANNSTQVQRFITEANNAATDTATQQANLRLTLQRLPPFLEQLRPALSKLGAATDANLPVLANLNAAAGQLNRLFTDLPSFSRSARPALKSLGQAAVTGITAVRAARPTDHPPEHVRPEHPGARPEPGHRAARSRQPQPRGRKGSAQPRRTGLHRTRGAAAVRVQPAAGHQHLRSLRPPADRRRVRQRDVHALRHAGHDRHAPEDVRFALPLVLLVARPAPARRQQHRSLRAERRRSGPGRSSPRAAGPGDERPKLAAADTSAAAADRPRPA